MMKLLVLVHLVSTSSAIILKVKGDGHDNGDDATAQIPELPDLCTGTELQPPAQFVSVDLMKQDPAKYIVIGTAPLPKQLQGVFWLANNSDGSALMSFGGPLASTDNDGCSSGRIGSDGSYCLREAGDGTWASATQGSFIYALARDCDRHLTYKFNSDHTQAEMHTEVGACPRNPIGCDALIGAMEANIALDMQLTDDCGVGTKLEGSHCWARRIWMKGPDGKPGPYPDARSYTMIQVIDGHGRAIEPAWSHFASDQANPFVTGSMPNTLVYRDWGSSQLYKAHKQPFAKPASA